MTATGKPPRKEPERSAFEEAMGEVTPLGDRDKLRPRRTARHPARIQPEESVVEFSIERSGEEVRAVAKGIDRRLLRRLHRGEFDIDLRIDLHGYGATAARKIVTDELQDAAQRGVRYALIVHGRGLHSEGDPVLKEALIGWLTSPPLATRVMAFSSAARDQGGAGATALLLRRTR